MIDVIGVRFRRAGKIYYFSPNGFDIKLGDNVIVETARGVEYGNVVIAPRQIEEEEIVSPLKEVIRVATPEDDEIERKNREKEKDAFKICLEKIKKHGLEMKLIDSEYTFDNNKVLFYFTAEGRIDFRELVKLLAAKYKARIDLHQIGVRDKAKEIGGLGPCGRQLCCNSFLNKLETITINMAKNQNIALNPSKINGSCGRLLCCLSYEDETYSCCKKELPSVGSQKEYNGKTYKVVSLNILKGTYTLQVDDELKEFNQDGTECC